MIECSKPPAVSLVLCFEFLNLSLFRSSGFVLRILNRQSNSPSPISLPCLPRFITTTTPTSPLLKGKTIAILGYGSQGHAQAQNLRDSGCKVIIGQRPGSPNYDLAVSHGFKPMSAAEATKQADLINILLPDEVQGDVYRNDIKPNLKPGNMLMCSHGFNIHFGQVEPPAGRRRAARRPEGPRPPGPQRVRKGRRRALPDRPGRRRERRNAQASAWPTPRASAAPAAASSKRPSPKKPRPTCSASRSCSAAA